MKIKTTANLTCPKCGHVHKQVEMPTDVCQYFFECEKCGYLMKSAQGKCCVFCSYADTKCPPKQLEESKNK